MRDRFRLVAAAVLALVMATPAVGQQTVKVCVPTPGNTGVPGCQDVTAASPFPQSGSATISGPLPSGTNNIGVVSPSVSAALTNPASVLTRPANALAYAQNDLVASSTVAGSVVVPAFGLAYGGAVIHRLRLVTNVTTGWDASTFTVRLWSAPPTYTNGDNGAYAVATGAAGYLGSFTTTLAQFADGASGVAVPTVGPGLWLRLASGTAVYWDLQYTGAGALTPTSGQTFTLTAEVEN